MDRKPGALNWSMPTCPDIQLVLVSVPSVNTEEDFAELAQWIQAIEPRILVALCGDEPYASASVAGRSLPTLIFSPGPLRRLRPSRGTVLQGQWLPKSMEYERLEAHGLPVPRWLRLGPTEHPSVEHWGPYVVVKPDRGARGADVRIQRSKGVAWRPPRTDCARILGGPLAPSIVQEFIYTGPWAISYRVATLLGEVLWCTAIEASHEHRPLSGPAGFVSASSGAGCPIVSSGKHCRVSLAQPPDVLALARAAHAAFPELALLGIDIVRDHTSGQLYVLEVNSAGLCWHFSSDTGRAIQTEFGFSFQSQFDGRRRASSILARQTVKLAR
ncbi:MAG TPA: ATP-grasp domain-containing protein [Polyangiaceae bacterium]